MSARSLNKVILIGNLTRDPELRYTPQGTAVCTFGLATNRAWTTQTGDTKEETEFHRIVAWNKLGELCAQLLQKGRKVYVEGRLSSHSWTGQDGQQRTTVEVVIEDMIVLDSRKVVPGAEGSSPTAAVLDGSTKEPSEHAGTQKTVQEEQGTEMPKEKESEENLKKKKTKQEKDKEDKQEKKSETANEDISPDDIPF